MYRGKVQLTSKEILEKDFMIDTRGYRLQEVDEFLDQVIKDYNAMNEIIDELEDDKKVLSDENIALKQEIRSLKMKLDALKSTDDGNNSSADVLRRLSNLEKIIYGKE
ncbi:MAG: DivIVA domain-containing protein [Bacilli bacterium]|nr:DivIVA domain-containing protein [Bacilli bacterium]